MKKLFILSTISLSLLSANSYAADTIQLGKQPIVSNINLQIQREGWVQTQTALVSVAVNASLDSAKVATFRSQLTGQLNKIAQGATWHITRFDRRQGDSGMENISALAQARLSQAQMNNLRGQAKALSKTGETYKIQSVQYQPSSSDVNRVRTELRNQIYTAVRSEQKHLNSLYSDQHFFVRSIEFDNERSPRANMVLIGAKAAANNAAPVSVSDKVKITAQVEFSAVHAD